MPMALAVRGSWLMERRHEPTLNSDCFTTNTTSAPLPKIIKSNHKKSVAGVEGVAEFDNSQSVGLG